MHDQIKDIDRLLDIQEYANLIIENRENISEEDFYNSRVNQFGLLKMLETIGEAAYQISRATRAEFTNLEWEKMIKARHVYVHDYSEIDWKRFGQV